MINRPRNVAILGSTGSIGRSAVEVIAASGGMLRAVALTACGAGATCLPLFACSISIIV